MSGNGTLLPIPEGDSPYQWLIGRWASDSWRWRNRSEWLGEFEQHLAVGFPQSSSADRKLTARHYAPFPLALGPDVS